MKKSIALIGAASLLTGAAVAELSGEAHVGYATQYIFRGQDLGNSLFYGGFDGTYSGLFGMKQVSASAGVWGGTFDFSPAGGPDVDSEVDIYGSLGYDFGAFQLETGYTFYLFPDTDDLDSQEAYFSLKAYCESCQVHAALTYYLDIADQDNGGYLEATVSRSFELSEKLSVDVELLAAYLLEEGEFSHVGATLALPIQLGEIFTISPYVAATIELDGLQDVSPSDAENEYIAGISLSAGF
jgi:hypothetical protein